MRNMFRLVQLSASVILLAALPLSAQHAEVPRTRTFSELLATAFPYAPPGEVGLPSEKLDRLGDEIVSWIANGELVGAELLVIKNGKAIFHEAYGWSDREARRPLRRNSIFSIGAMSKPFTATAALMLVDEGKLALDDPAKRYIPWLTHDGIRVRHLLSNTSGFIGEDDWYDYVSPGASLEQLIEEWPDRDPERPLGTFNTGDFNFAALAYIVTKVSGTPAAVFIEERIIRPLRLKDTRVGFSADPAWRARLNPWYRWNEKTREYDLRRTSDFRGWTTYPGGWGLLSTAMDYAVFTGMWMNAGEWRGLRLLSESTAKMALRPHAYEEGTAVFGHGWFVDEQSGAERLSFYHGGHGMVAIAFPADEAIVVYMTHSQWGPHWGAFWNRLYMSGLFAQPGFGLEFTAMTWADQQKSGEIQLPSEERARYVGFYAAGEPGDDISEVLRVLENDSVLILRKGSPGAKADVWFDLVPLGDHAFRLGRRQDGRLIAMDDRHEIRFDVADGAATVLELVKDDRVLISARRVE